MARASRGFQGGPALRILVLLLVVGIVTGAVLAAAFGGGDNRAATVEVELLGTRAAATRASIATRTAQPPGAEPDATSVVVTGLAYPIAGACLPQDDGLLPGASRAYRNGVHEGLDFYDSDNCTAIGLDTEVLAAKAGTVIRADWTYRDLTADELAGLEAGVQLDGYDPQIEDAFRGRQVWIDHGDGVVTRYAHLSGVADGVEVGLHVEAGELIAYVGESGTPESVTDPGTEHHLHFEIRTGASYLGKGRPPSEVRRLYEQAFSPSPAG